MFHGKKINIGGTEYIVPPLTLGQLRTGITENLEKHDKLIGEGKLFEALSLRGEIIALAMQRNYPELSTENVLELLDTQNVNSVWMFILGMSGLGEEEAPAAGANLTMTSDPSMPLVPALTDGPEM